MVLGLDWLELSCLGVRDLIRKRVCFFIRWVTDIADTTTTSQLVEVKEREKRNVKIVVNSTLLLLLCWSGAALHCYQNSKGVLSHAVCLSVSLTVVRVFARIEVATTTWTRQRKT